MRCPYLIKSHWHTQNNIFNRDNPEYLDLFIEGEGWIYEECLKSDCGAWQDCRCKYNEK